ncbi:PspA/IM30 family protein [Methylomarinum vadi]|uniref:PspA/IM30 family protein n=1 Tax=Methylomarinum vadi TaxID=438855 RepID=UPI0004DFB85F|nr:PspA/IM30 family protein [Methylomarinum vadi]
MNILTKLITALRGVGNEAGEAIIDSQGIRIMEQEIRDARESLDYAKENLTEVLAEQMAAKREVKRLDQDIAEHEDYATQALDKNDEALALEISGKIAELTNQHEAQSAMLENYTAQISSLKQTIAQTDRNIQAIERELAIVKTTDSVQKANAAIAAKFSGTDSALRSATESLERIKAKQQKRNDRMQAAFDLQQEEQGGDLQSKLQQAGIVTADASADSILAKLKAKRSS